VNSFDILSRTTPLQRRLFLEASAGTGKTFTIEHLVVRLLLETDFTIEQILVVTFTRAATRELKVRIRANLEKTLTGGQTFDYLTDMTEGQRNKIKTALLTFDRAQIFTIHGFCHRLLQEFAFEAFVGLELHEWEGKEEKWAVLQFLRSSDHLTPQQLKRLLGSFRNDIDKLVEKLLSLSESETKIFSSEQLLQQANQNLSQLTPFSVAEAFEEIRPHYKGMTSPDFIAQAAALEKAVERGHLMPEEWDRLIGEEELFLEGIEPSNVKARSKFSGHPAMEQLRAALIPSLEIARHPRKILQLLSQAWAEERKRLSRLYEKVAPDDLLNMVQERLVENSFVEEIRKKYQAVIVDEFQDTDPVQWKIFETLFFTDPTKSVYLVGDPKQSIYAFRKADIYTFLEAAKGFDIQQKAMLTTNYRSTQGLLDSLNQLLCAKPWIDLPKLQQTLAVPPSKAAKAGEGELCFMVADGEAGTGKRWPTPELEQQFFSFIIHEIHRLNLEPREMAVLVKDRYQALRVKSALQKWQIPCVLYRGASLGDSIMIDLLEELVDACHGADPLSSMKKVLLGPFVRVSIEELTDEFVFQAKGFFAELAATWLKSGFAAFLARFLQMRFSKWTVLQTLSLEDALYDDFMQIVEKVLYIQDPHQMINTLHILKTQETEERISAHPHGIQIMTIHASKGLEFETVFALGLGSRTPFEDKPEEFLKELDAEKMRQLYVALTRAKRRLYIPFPRQQTSQPLQLGEASPIELFWERAAPDLNSFTHVHLNQVEFQLRPYLEKSRPTLVPPPSRTAFFKPLFLQSFTSLARTFGETAFEAIGSSELRSIPSSVNQGTEEIPSGSETGIIIHRIFERLFDDPADLSLWIHQEIKGSHLEAYEAAIHAMINQALDLQLDGFSLRDVDRSKVMPEMEFLFPADGTSLKGFIDLSFEHQGKFYLIDWKTNALENYAKEGLEKAMIEHDYHLQGKIYATALTRYLKLYGHSAYFGGVFFLFVRGPAAYHFLPGTFDD
jgi:exodeoxyribonuclease V beta subunit